MYQRVLKLINLKKGSWSSHRWLLIPSGTFMTFLSTVPPVDSISWFLLKMNSPPRWVWQFWFASYFFNLCFIISYLSLQWGDDLVLLMLCRNDISIIQYEGSRWYSFVQGAHMWWWKFTLKPEKVTKYFNQGSKPNKVKNQHMLIKALENLLGQWSTPLL